MDPYSNYFTSMDPEVISMQVNYLRMLANYYNPQDTSQIDPDPEENILEKSLRAESVFLQNDLNDAESLQSENFSREILSFSPPNKNSAKNEDFDEPAPRTQFLRKDSVNKSFKSFKSFEDEEENYVVQQPIRRQVSYGNDDQPIKAGGSFEQILERELKKANITAPLMQEERSSMPPRVKSQRIPTKPKIEDLPLRKDPEPKPEAAFPAKNPRQSIALSALDRSDDIMTPKTKPSEGSPKPRNKFLKRGQGKLCTDKKSLAKPASANTSRVIFNDKSEVMTDLQFSDKDEDVDKALYLDEQIKHYNNENNKLQKLVKEVEDKKKRLDRERNDFLKEKEKKLEEFEKWKNEEIEKIKKEKILYEKKLRMQMKEKDEIQELKKQIEKLEKEKQEIRLSYENQLKVAKAPVAKTSKFKYQSSESEENDRVSDCKPSKSISDSSFNEELQKGEDLESDARSDHSGPSEHSDRSERSERSEHLNHSNHSDHLSSSSESSNKNQILRPPGGKKELVYSNGIKKEVYPDGYSIVYFNNKDIKQCFPDGRIVYHYAEAKTVQTTFPDGLQLFKFSNGQIEKHFPDGSKEISFQDGTVKCVYPDGQEESVFPDGTVQTVDSKGVKYIEFVNGQRDTIYPNGVKIRKFPDGRVKKIMPDGKIIDQ